MNRCEAVRVQDQIPSEVWVNGDRIPPFLNPALSGNKEFGFSTPTKEPALPTGYVARGRPTGGLDGLQNT